MFPRPALLALLAPAALLSACASGNRGIESVHQPVVSRYSYVLDLNTSGYTLAPGEAQRLAGWMSAMRIGYGDHIALDDPSGIAGVREQVSTEAARYGLLLADDAPVTPGQIGAGMVRVVVTRSTAQVTDCDGTRQALQPDYNQNTSPDYGCAVNANLAAMVARPEDLVRGQPGSETSDPFTAQKAIQTFRSTATTGSGGLKSAGTTGGSSSQ